MKRVFVTGASSELMRSVLSHLPQNQFQITALSRFDREPDGNLTWVKGDIASPSNFASQVQESDIVIHAAAITHSRDEKRYFDVNVDATRRLLEAVIKNENTRVVFISSRTASKESGAYGESKLEAESVVKSFTKNWLIIRPAEIYGGTKGEGIDGAIESALKGGLVPCPVGLKSKMYPIHTGDAATAIAKAILDEEKTNEVVYINGPEALSFKQLLNQVQKVTDKSIVALPIPKLVMKMAALFSSLLNIDLGFVPDQVDRLYGPKEEGEPSPTSKTISQHIKDQFVNEN